MEATLASVGPPTARRARRKVTRRWAAGLVGAAMLGVVAATLANGAFSSMPAPATVPGVRSAADVPKIAVLPFVDIGGWPENESLAEGLTEELIGMLARMRGLRVVGRTSVFAFAEETRDARAIGRALGVGHLLEGSIRREDDHIRVRATLIDVASGLDIWSETYDRKVDDLFTIWSDLAGQIANALKAELTPADRARLAQHAARPSEAHALYLKGRHFWNQRTPAAYGRAIEYFERSIVADPSHAAAYAGLAITYQLRSIYGDLSPREAGEHALAAALKALQIDDQLAEAHVALGGYLNAWAWQPAAAERSLLRAIEADPEYAYARHVYAIVLRCMGRVEEELVQRRLAVELDPLDPHLNAKLGEALLRAGRLDEAAVSLAAAIELDSNYWEAHRSLGELHAAANRPAEAARHLHRAVELAGDMPNAGGSFARTLARIGREEEARELLTELETQASRSGIYAPIIATVRAELRDIDGALEWLEHAYRQRHPGLALFVADGPLAQEPRYLDLMRRVGRL